MFSLRKKKKEARQNQIDKREAFNLWDILNSKYIVVERLQIWQNFTHDTDLVLYLQKHIKSLYENIYILQKQMNKYSVKAPDQYRSTVNSNVKPKIVTDEFIALDFLLYMQEHVENLLKTFVNTTTNDSLREIVKNMLQKTIKELDTLIKYLKFKGWIETPPLYKDVPPRIEEKITTAEAANLWDHLTYRYDNIRTTGLAYSFAHDGDFKIFLDMGLKKLDKQVNTLEKELYYFALPLPKKPSKTMLTPDNTEIFNDDHLFRTLHAGLQQASTLHARSYKECSYNDRIRKMFKKLLLEEIECIDKFIELGKFKGWLNPPPIYSP